MSFGTASSVQVDALEIGLEVPASSWSSIRLVGSTPLSADRDGESFRIWSVPLAPGDNALELEALHADGQLVRKHLLVRNSATPISPLRVRFEPEVCQPGEVVHASLILDEALADPIQILLDVDRDGLTDFAYSPDDRITLTFTSTGIFKPRVSVRTRDGMLFSNIIAHTHAIRCLPANDPQPNWGPAQALPALSDVEALSGGRFMGLAPLQRRALIFDGHGIVSQEISLSMCVAPQGLAVDSNGDVYVADRGAHAVVRLSAELGYVLDASFGDGGVLGRQGTAPLEFDSPSDVALIHDVLDRSLRIFVADTGNHRVQIIDNTGRVLVLTNGVGGPGGWPAFERPTRLVALPGGGVAVIDREQHSVRALGIDGVPIEFGLHGASTGGLGLGDPVSVSIAPSGGLLLVGDAIGPRAHLMTMTGVRVRSWSLDRVPEALAWAQLDPAPRLLVAGDGSSGGLIGYAVREDPEGFESVDAARAAIAAIVSGDPTGGPVDAQLAETLIVLLADPVASTELVQTLSGIDSFTLVSSSGNYALVQGRRTGQAAAELQLLLNRDERSAMWSLVNL